MLKDYNLQDLFLKKSLIVLVSITVLIAFSIYLLFNEDLHHFDKTLISLFALGISFVGVLYFFNSNPQYSCLCSLFANTIFAITLLWIRQTYESTSNLALLLNIIAYSSLLLAYVLKSYAVMIQGVIFSYTAFLYALFDFSNLYLAFLILLVLGFYLIYKTDKQWLKMLNFLNLIYFLSLIFIFKQALWLIPLWIIISALFLSHKPSFISTSIIDKLVFSSLLFLVMLLEFSNLFISDILQENWIWIFGLITFSFLLWIEKVWGVCLFILLFICTPLLETFLLRQDIFFFYYWLLFFVVWLDLALRWAILGFFMLCFFVLFQYLLFSEEYLVLGIFFAICCAVLSISMMIRSKNAN